MAEQKAFKSMKQVFEAAKEVNATCNYIYAQLGKVGKGRSSGEIDLAESIKRLNLANQSLLLVQKELRPMRKFLTESLKSLREEKRESGSTRRKKKKKGKKKRSSK